MDITKTMQFDLSSDDPVEVNYSAIEKVASVSPQQKISEETKDEAPKKETQVISFSEFYTFEQNRDIIELLYPDWKIVREVMMTTDHFITIEKETNEGL